MKDKLEWKQYGNWEEVSVQDGELVHTISEEPISDRQKQLDGFMKQMMTVLAEPRS